VDYFFKLSLSVQALCHGKLPSAGTEPGSGPISGTRQKNNQSATTSRGSNEGLTAMALQSVETLENS